MASSFSRLPRSATCATSHFSGNYRAERDRTRDLGEKDRQRSGGVPLWGCENAKTSPGVDRAYLVPTLRSRVTRTVKLAVEFTGVGSRITV